MDTTAMELQILELEAKMKKTRNVVERAKWDSQITDLKNKIAEANDTKERKPSIQKDVPVVADHTEINENTKRLITNSGDLFTALL